MWLDLVIDVETQRYPHELHASFPDALLPSMKGVP